jgi:hypothetical protein
MDEFHRRILQTLPASLGPLPARRRCCLRLMSLLRPHHADPGEHRWPVVLCNQEKRLHRGLPFVGIVFCLGQFGDEERGVATSGFRPGSMIGSKDR